MCHICHGGYNSLRTVHAEWWLGTELRFKQQYVRCLPEIDEIRAKLAEVLTYLKDLRSAV